MEGGRKGRREKGTGGGEAEWGGKLVQGQESKFSISQPPKRKLRGKDSAECQRLQRPTFSLLPCQQEALITLPASPKILDSEIPPADKGPGELEPG